jgi:hypothetical protein
VGLAVLKENRRMRPSGEALEQLSPESRLAHAVAAQDLASEVEIFDTDRSLGEMIVDAAPRRGSGFSLIIGSARGACGGRFGSFV